MEAAPQVMEAGPMISVVGALAVMILGPHVVPMLLTSGLIAGAFLTGMN